MLKMKITWVTEITHIKKNDYFVDEQRKGPYKMWHHEHKIIKTDEGILMTDLITYEPPFGFSGRLANKLLYQTTIK